MLEEISIRDFRNYSNCTVPFVPGDNILAGANGVGKSNILEAVYFASFLRSFRTVRWKELVRIGSESMELSISVKKGNWRHKRKVRFEFPEKRLLSGDSGTISKASDYVQVLRPVIFAPVDRGLVSGSAGVRRNFFDMLIALSDSEYWHALRAHSQALLRRNAALKDGREDSIRAFETVIAESAVIITKAREEWVQRLSRELEKFSSDMQISYRSDCREYTSVGSYLAAFDKYRHREMLKKCSCFGPQRDDFEIIFEEKPARYFASTGQGRMLALKLKLAQASLMRSCSEIPVIALIDDVTGDLDRKARESFLQELQIFPQRIYTFTAPPEGNFFANAGIIKFSAPGIPVISL